MGGFVETAQFLVLTGCLFGAAAAIKPFWFIRRRWQGAVIILAGFVAFSMLEAVPLARPAHISETEWAERESVCGQANRGRTCPLDDAEVQAARLDVAEAARAAQADLEVENAERQAREAERLTRAREREEAAAARASEPAPNKLDDSTQQQLWIAATERAVRNTLRDPSSARFRNSRFHVFQGETPVVCGEVNSNNAMGGRTGFQRYIASGETFGPFLEEMMPAGEFATTWNQVCR